MRAGEVPGERVPSRSSSRRYGRPFACRSVPSATRPDAMSAPSTGELIPPGTASACGLVPGLSRRVKKSRTLVYSSSGRSASSRFAPNAAAKRPRIGRRRGARDREPCERADGPGPGFLRVEGQQAQRKGLPALGHRSTVPEKGPVLIFRAPRSLSPRAARRKEPHELAPDDGLPRHAPLEESPSPHLGRGVRAPDAARKGRLVRRLRGGEGAPDGARGLEGHPDPAQPGQAPRLLPPSLRPGRRRARRAPDVHLHAHAGRGGAEQQLDGARTRPIGSSADSSTAR